MEILKVNYEVGNKCYLRYNGAIREAIFLGTIGRAVDKRIVRSYYYLNVAGVGKGLYEFDRQGNFDCWWGGGQCETILYKTAEDCLAKKNPIMCQYGSTDNCSNTWFMEQFFPGISVCNCGGSCWTYLWDGTQAVCTYVHFCNHQYILDENGFHFLGYMTPDLTGRKLYRTAAECMADNKPVVVTF